MRTPYPKDIVPLILEGEGTELFAVLETNGFIFELNEVKKQWDFCLNKLDTAWKISLNDFNCLKNISHDNDYNLAICSIKSPLVKILKEAKKLNYTSEEQLKQIWNVSSDYLVEKLFSKNEQNPPNIPKTKLKTNLIKSFKKFDLKKEFHKIKDCDLKILKHDENWWKLINDDNDGIAKNIPFFENDEWVVECFCGRKMNLFSIPEYNFSHHCIRYPQ
jgi:hypothetical protein